MRSIDLRPSALFAWQLSNYEAHFSGSARILPIHLYVAILKIIDDAAYSDAEMMEVELNDLDGFEVDITKTMESISLSEEEITALRRSLQYSIPRKRKVPPKHLLHRSSETREIFYNAARIAFNENRNKLSLVHLLIALTSSSYLVKILEQTGKLKDLRLDEGDIRYEKRDTRTRRAQIDKGGDQSGFLERIGRDLTKLAEEGRLVNVVGRKDEMTMIARHLLRTSKRNVLLTGPPGVGKTVVVEGLAQKIADNEVPKELKNVRIIEISISNLMSGTRYRGDLEERTQKLIRIAEEDPNLILFLDEIHLAINPPADGGAGVDIANILKPALTRGKLRCIGATTSEDYERYVKKDNAFRRRFQLVRINEPNRPETINICKSWVVRIEQYQGVKFEEGVIERAVDITSDLVLDRSNPDKVIDLLENVATYVKVTTLSADRTQISKTTPQITVEDVVSAFEEQYEISVDKGTGIDVGDISKKLNQNIIGQERATEKLIGVLASKQNTFSESGRPAAVILFTGPTGVGKTYTAELMGEVAEENRGGFRRFNMSEFKERHELARLIGSPPGFIGHEEEGALFRFAKRSPQGVILLDEMEKAHPEISDYFLQIFDKGEAADRRGKIVSFRNHIFIITCNFYRDKQEDRVMGFVGEGVESKAGDISNDLKKFFRDEFIARIDEVIEFQVFARDTFLELFKEEMKTLNQNLDHEFNINLSIDEGMISQLCWKSLEKNEGARGFKRYFEREIRLPTVTFIQENEIADADLNMTDAGDILKA